MNATLPEAKARLQRATGIWKAGADRMLAQIDSWKVDAACIPGDQGSYGWSVFGEPFIHFCNTALRKITGVHGWWLHEGSHIVLDTGHSGSGIGNAGNWAKL